MEEITNTLRYFYSAVFQGFAALITLGGMFYIFFKQFVDSNKDKLENRMQDQIKGNYINGKVPREFATKDILKYSRKYVEEGKSNLAKQGLLYDALKRSIEEYDLINNKLESVKFKIPIILSFTISILMISLISLFSIGYWQWLNITLIGLGIVTISLAVFDLIKIRNLIKEIIKT